MKKLFYFIVTLIIITINLCSCSLIYDKVLYEIKDTNGDDISLAILTDEDICIDLPGNYCLNPTYKWTGDEPSFPDEDFNDDRENAHMTANTPFSGVEIIQPTYGKTDTIIFSVSSILTSGNLRIVVIDTTDYSIVGEFAINTTDDIEICNAINKIYELRVAGESAIFSIDVTREFK